MKNVFKIINEIEESNFQSEYFKLDSLPPKFYSKKRKYIYLLKDEDTVVYVGKTECNPEERLSRPSSHDRGIYKKTFDSFLIIEIPNHLDILTVETYFIFKYQPKYNKTGGSKELNVILKHHFQTDWSPYDWVKGPRAVNWTDVKPFRN